MMRMTVIEPNECGREEGGREVESGGAIIFYSGSNISH